jgi:hypothetical protein
MKLRGILLVLIVLMGLTALQPNLVLAAPGHFQSVVLQITPASQQGKGQPGATVSYIVNVTAEGTDPVTVNASADSQSKWGVTLSPARFTVEGGKTMSISVNVLIPGTASNGQVDVTNINFTVGDGSVVGYAAIETKVEIEEGGSGFDRPMVVLTSYKVDGGDIAPKEDFTLTLNIANRGDQDASNVVVTFESTEFLPLNTGGIRSVGGLLVGESRKITQSMVATGEGGKAFGTVTAKVSYSDAEGKTYADSFSLTITLKDKPQYDGPGHTATPTTTATSVPKPQLVVTGYKSDIDPLQPGSTFNLNLDIKNMGSAEAKNITLVLGGGGANVDTSSGTPVPGGTSGGSSETSNFGPLGSSNLVYLDNLGANHEVKYSAKMIVNVSTNPGAYPFKISFVYNGPGGVRLVDDQVITLLVFALPQVEVMFYREVGVLIAGQPTQLPIQINNTSRKSAILGKVKVTAQKADLSNNTGLVGALDAGGYFTIDANITPQEPGPLELEITINYNDDFNQPRSLTEKMSLMVEPAPVMEVTPTGGKPGQEGGPDGPGLEVEESFTDKVWRFVKGLLGFDSGTPQPVEGSPEMTPPGEPETKPAAPKG